MTIVMGLDQHRAQITADWVDTATGEVSRARVTPADRVVKKNGAPPMTMPFRLVTLMWFSMIVGER